MMVKSTSPSNDDAESNKKTKATKTSRVKKAKAVKEPKAPKTSKSPKTAKTAKTAKAPKKSVAESGAGDMPQQEDSLVLSDVIPDHLVSETEQMDDFTYPDDLFETDSDRDLLNQITGVYQIWWNWAHFELTVVSPEVETISPCVIIPPEAQEFVYPINDYGHTLSTSKGSEMYSVGMSMCKLFYTIEKMIHILVERFKRDGITTSTEVQIAFDGHQLAQRKAFESVINLSYNVVVTNFDPGVWGERYLEIVKRLADRGYGYPAEAPRDTYKNVNKESSTAAKR